ncbi:MAG: adenosylmethionine--8-amino-7-oxononanoate transaminase [Thalassolituus sp.]|jgi:adenosylmethionine-8-amino-7-oxononanoate aminotransferase|uniref:adenosylmethionine--8-amino-7-oxononanoate transaminase n=1 Tax=Thalassolituus sp. TaxID=2030822 RepID=UPI0027D4D337|nr:adenosylmethionine--8-amino-7-oxononanoate transaminase [Thalassolituus sp.]MDQ4422758.1 adenosylmethionine--8-amino-7-oxononanoate transaminase [Thalassolituus sp.]MDQ4425783.1 adenosylmethionine--8-amino-7-oxononanoate transaminase [Thalassolituus sp.]
MSTHFIQPDLNYDREHVWHPYSSMTDPGHTWPVVSASGVRLKLQDGRELIDGMSSWWCTVHGYNHPVLNAALNEQAERMSHVMFGGLTHGPAIELARRLVALTPDGLEKVFIADSGSVSVEVAIKMAIQYQHARGETTRTRLLALERGYHGDTLGAMSVCDPKRGMHHLFSGILPEQFFVPAPQTRFEEEWNPADIAPLRECLEKNHKSIAALILEPVVQGAGGMRFYHPEYLRQARSLCDEFGVLLIADEIATGFGRSGKLFACEYAGINPDIMCVGKAITGGYMTLAATLATTEVAETISRGEAGCFMHGPTFMANPLACRVACASLDLLMENNWQRQVSGIELGLKQGLSRASELEGVADVRVLGAIGVIELKDPVDVKRLQPACVDRGIWVRPFAHNFYVMPPYIMREGDLAYLTSNMVGALAQTLGE